MNDARVVVEGTHLQPLLDDIEETLKVDGLAPLYEFSWFLRGLDDPPAEGGMQALVAEAYAEINRRHQLRLVWMAWPEAYLEDVVDGDEADFFMGESGRYMVLVPIDWTAP